MTDPVTLDEAKAFLRVTHDAEDAVLATLLGAARVRVERELGVAVDTASPAPVRLAVLLLAAHAFDDRAGEIPPALDAWVAPYRAVRL